MSVYTITQSKLRGGRLSAELARHDPPEPVEFDRLSAFAKLSCDDMKSMNLEITALICLHVIRTSGSFSDRLCSSSLMAADSACCVCSILGLLSETRLVARAQSLSSACSAERNPKILHGVINTSAGASHSLTCIPSGPIQLFRFISPASRVQADWNSSFKRSGNNCVMLCIFSLIRQMIVVTSRFASVSKGSVPLPKIFSA